MKTRNTITAILLAVLTTMGMAVNHDSVLNKGTTTGTEVSLSLDSLKAIELEEEKPVHDVAFLCETGPQHDSRPQLTIYGQHLSEPREEDPTNL